MQSSGNPVKNQILGDSAQSALGGNRQLQFEVGPAFAIYLDAQTERVKTGCRKLQAVNLSTLYIRKGKPSVVVRRACP